MIQEMRRCRMLHQSRYLLALWWQLASRALHRHLRLHRLKVVLLVRGLVWSSQVAL